MSTRMITVVAVLGIIMGIGGYLLVHGNDLMPSTHTMRPTVSSTAVYPHGTAEELIEGQLP